MFFPFRAFFCGLAIVSVAGGFAATSAKADILGKLIKPHLETFPQCDDQKVLRDIIKRFNWAEQNTWQRGFGLDDITEVRERTVVAGENEAIPRRYCRGHAQLSNGRHPTVLYLIEGGQGFAGTGHKVQFCVNGLDPWRMFDGSCRAINY